MKTLLLTLSILLAAWSTYAAGQFSYLYIQGDKQTPFYVKLEEGMQPRYGKNYCIISRLAPGPAHIEILFQQNAFPAQQFTVQIPEGGSRGFLLVKKEEGFSLYDLQQGFYLPAGNKAEDDRLPAEPASAIAAVSTPEPAKAIPEPPAVVVREEPAKSEMKPRLERKPLIKPKPAAARAAPAPDGKPVFIRDIEFSKGDPPHDDAVPTTGMSGTSGNADARPAITNSDCPAPLAGDAFSSLFNALSKYDTDEDRLDFLNGKMDQCYATWQARILAGRLSGDAARYQLLKNMYSRITDQADFPLLDDLLTTDIWKSEFARLTRR